MELVRYKPGEAIRWLHTGAERIRKDAQTRSKSLINQTGTDQKTFGANVRTAAGALVDLGRSAMTELAHNQAQASEYVLQDEHFDIVKGTSIRSIPYSQVKKIAYSAEKALLTLEKGTLTIKPHAHISTGRMRVPIGWTRNGTEVPYELLIDELAARCRLEIEED